MHDRRSPQGERGLKLAYIPQSWDEISRSPQGERGLKQLGQLVEYGFVSSLPARGAWVETSSVTNLLPLSLVAPRKGSVG